MTLTPEDQALLARARKGLEPTPEDHARIKHRLLVQIAGGALTATALSTSAEAAGTTTALGSAATGFSVLAKVVAAGVLSAAVVGGGIVASTRTSHSRVADTRASAREVLKPATLPAAPLAPRVSASPEASGSIPAPAESLPARLAPPVSPIATVHATTPAPREGETSPTTIAGPGTIGAEAKLLTRADAALKGGDALHALELLDEHASSFSDGVLVEERQSERVVVLCALGRTEDARAEASAFLRKSPRSPLAARVRASCGGL